MGWNVSRGRYGADALEPKEIQSCRRRLQAPPTTSLDGCCEVLGRVRRRPWPLMSVRSPFSCQRLLVYFPCVASPAPQRSRGDN